MPDGPALQLLSLPAAVAGRWSRSGVRDAVQYFDPDLVVVPGSRDAGAYAAARDAAPDVPTVHPPLGRAGERVTHHRYDGSAGVYETTETAPTSGAIDILAVQEGAVLPDLEAELRTGSRRTSGGAATYLVVPRLAVEWNTTTLSTHLPHHERLGAIAAALPERVVVLAGGQPADYRHAWSLAHDGTAVDVPVAGLGALDRGGAELAQLTCTSHGATVAESVGTDGFGLRALDGVGAATARRLRERGCRTREDVRNLGVGDLAELSGIGRETAERIHAHAEVIASGEPLVLTNKAPVKTRGDRPPLCLDIETDGLSPTIIWQFGVYDPLDDSYRAFVERRTPNDPTDVLEAFMEWFLATHDDRTVLTWNGYGFDYPQIEQFLRRYHPHYLDAWADVWTDDLYAWAVRDGNALLPGRTNELAHVARALGYDGTSTGLSGARTAVVYQAFMRNPDDPETEPDWKRHEAYCEDDCRALWDVYEAIENAERRDVTDSGTGGAAGRQAGLTDFSS